MQTLISFPDKRQICICPHNTAGAGFSRSLWCKFLRMFFTARSRLMNCLFQKPTNQLSIETLRHCNTLSCYKNKCDFHKSSSCYKLVNRFLYDLVHLKPPSVSAARRAAAADSNSSGLMPMASCISVVAAVMKSSSMWRPRPCSRNTRPTSSRAGLRDFWPRDTSDLRKIIIISGYK